MQRRQLRIPILLIFTLLLLLSLPDRMANGLRSAAITPLAPIWGILHSPLAARGQEGGSPSIDHERLLLENERLSEEVAWLSDLSWLERALRFHAGELGEVEEGRAARIASLLTQELFSLPARVVFRDPSSWSNSLWIDVGEQDNRVLGERIVAKNSPVVLGASLVGIVEYVGRAHSRVRLITDAALHPSVRTARGGVQDRRLVELIDELQEELCARDDLFETPQSAALLLDNLNLVRERLSSSSCSFYLAKGEMQGSSEAAWRGFGSLLRGVGFNYDFADEEGPARDLRTGAPIGKGRPIPLVEVGDLLVTTGMDGLFPPGLHVATVVSIEPLREGSYCYSLDARPTAGSMEGLRLLFVLPPVTERPDWTQ